MYLSFVLWLHFTFWVYTNAKPQVEETKYNIGYSKHGFFNLDNYIENFKFNEYLIKRCE